MDSELSQSSAPRDSAPSQLPHSVILSTVPEDMPNQGHGVRVLDQAGVGENETEIVQTLLQIADVPVGRITEEQHWISSKVRISQEQGLEGKFRIRSSCGQLLVSKYIASFLTALCVRRLTAVVDPAMDELIPSYAYHHKSPIVWFRKAGKDVRPCFAAVSGAILGTH